MANLLLNMDHMGADMYRLRDVVISCFCDVWFEEDFRRRSSSHRQEGCVGAPICSILEILNLSAVYNK